MAPTLVINGDQSIDILQTVGTYNELGGIAIDNNGNNISNKINISNLINVNVVGSYYVEYTVTDLVTGLSAKAYRQINVKSTTYDFAYTGSSQTFTAPYDGNYKVELWGAEGQANTIAPGKGGYTKGEITLNKGDIIYAYVGGQTGGFNGGAARIWRYRNIVWWRCN